MSKCKCKCQCCCCEPSPTPTTHKDVLAKLSKANIELRLSGAIILEDHEYTVYRDGLLTNIQLRDHSLYEVGINNLLFCNRPVVSKTELGLWRCRAES